MDRARATRGLEQLGAVFTGFGLIATGAAWLHMFRLAETYGVICGAGASLLAHCPACPASVALLGLGAASFSLARTQLSPIQVSR